MQNLKGVSVLEAIVASIVFLLIFIISADIVTRMAARRTDTVLLEMEQNFNDVIGRYKAEWINPGKYIERFGWGDVEIEVTPYRYYDNINQVEFRTIPENNSRTIMHTIIVCRD